MDKTNQNWLPWQRPLSDRKINFSHSSTNPENLAKIDPVDYEIVGLTGIAQKYQ